MFRCLPVAAGLIDAQLRFLDVNDAFLTCLSMGRDQLLAQSIDLLTPPGTDHVNRQGCLQLEADDMPGRWSAGVLTGPGTVIDMVVAASRFVDRGEIRFMLTLQRSDPLDWLQRSFDDAPVGLVVTDQRGRLIRANRTVTRQTGATSAQKLAGLAGSAQDVQSGRTRVSLGPAGPARRWFDRVSTQLESDTGQRLTVTALHEVTRDLMARLQEHTRMQQQMLVLRAVPVPVAQLLDGRIVMVNPAFARFLLRPESELVGTLVAAMLDLPGQSGAPGQTDAPGQKNQLAPSGSPTVFVLAGGERRHGLVNLSPLHPSRRDGSQVMMILPCDAQGAALPLTASYGTDG